MGVMKSHESDDAGWNTGAGVGGLDVVVACTNNRERGQKNTYLPNAQGERETHANRECHRGSGDAAKPVDELTGRNGESIELSHGVEPGKVGSQRKVVEIGSEGQVDDIQEPGTKDGDSSTFDRSVACHAGEARSSRCRVNGRLIGAGWASPTGARETRRSADAEERIGRGRLRARRQWGSLKHTAIGSSTVSCTKHAKCFIKRN